MFYRLLSKMEDRFGIWGPIFGIFGLTLILFVVLIGISSMIPPDPNIALCESKGGVWLRHTYSSGKSNSSEVMGCFNPNAFIDLTRP